MGGVSIAAAGRQRRTPIGGQVAATPRPAGFQRISRTSTPRSRDAQGRSAVSTGSPRTPPQHQAGAVAEARCPRSAAWLQSDPTCSACRGIESDHLHAEREDVGPAPHAAPSRGGGAGCRSLRRSSRRRAGRRARTRTPPGRRRRPVRWSKGASNAEVSKTKPPLTRRLVRRRRRLFPAPVRPLPRAPLRRVDRRSVRPPPTNSPVGLASASFALQTAKRGQAGRPGRAAQLAVLDPQAQFAAIRECRALRAFPSGSTSAPAASTFTVTAPMLPSLRAAGLDHSAPGNAMGRVPDRVTPPRSRRRGGRGACARAGRGGACGGARRRA